MKQLLRLMRLGHTSSAGQSVLEELQLAYFADNHALL